MIDKFDSFITEGMHHSDVTRVVNEKLQSLGFDVTFDRIESNWGSRAKEKTITPEQSLFSPMYERCHITIKPTYHPEIHSTYNPQLVIRILINYYFIMGKGKHETYQVYCSYPVDKGKWNKDEIRGGVTKNDPYM